MYNFILMLRLLGIPVCAGVIKGFRKGWPSLRDTLNESMLEVFADEATPIDTNPDIEALKKARNVMVEKIKSGKPYLSVDEILLDLRNELEFQRIIIRQK